MTYTRETVEFLVPTIWDDSLTAWGMRRPYAPDQDMPKQKANPKTAGTIMAESADIKRAWDRAPLTMPERRAVFLVTGQGLTYDEAGHVLNGISKQSVQEACERGIGRLTAWLNGDTYVPGYGLDDINAREDVQV